MKTLKPRVQLLQPARLAPKNSRQATRALHTDSVAWKQIRQRVLMRDLYMCRGYEPDRHADGCDGFATEVDHIDGDASKNDIDGLQSLSKPCHSKKTAREQMHSSSVLTASKPSWTS